MSEIDYERAVFLSEQWANDITLDAMRYALELDCLKTLEIKDLIVEASNSNKTSVLTPKQWARLCTFFIVPNDEMDPNLNFNFQDKLSAAPINKIIKFIYKTVQKKVLNIVIMDHEMPFEQREDLLGEASDDLPIKALWEPKSSVFSKKFTCTLNEDRFRSTIKNFVGHHLSNHQLVPYEVSSLVHQATKPVKRSSRTGSTGPM